ncbi:histidine phosphatase family protein [Chloroflexota bacterium]
MPILILARHGQSHGNLDYSLGPDTTLTDLGREQARRLGSWLAGQDYHFTAIYASPLQRARQTAEIINGHFGLEIQVDPDLCETEHPYLEVLPQRQSPLDREPPPPFESEYEQMRRRVARATTRILEENLEGKVLVSAHAGTLGTMLRGILNCHAMVVHTELAAVHGLAWEDGRWTLQYTNHRDHLRG